MEIQTLFKKLEELKKNEAWGIYFIGKFYFSINTGRNQDDFGIDLLNKKGLSPTVQRELQKENLPAIFHEYIHYLHEISTNIGTLSMALDITLRCDFTHLLDSQLDHIYFNGYEDANEELKSRHDKVTISQLYILGDAGEIDVCEIETAKLENDFFFVPYNYKPINLKNLKVNYKDLNNNSKTVNFGKFFIYEGIAYELDSYISQKMGNAIRSDNYNHSEYLILKMLAKKYAPNIETPNIIKLAVLSLSYLNCGPQFYIFLIEYNKLISNGKKPVQIIKLFKDRVSKILKKNRRHFIEAQAMLIEPFAGRTRQLKAIEYLLKVQLQCYDMRINNPVFEVDLVYNNQYKNLVELVKICDFIYIFNGKDEYMKAFLGSILNDPDTSDALKSWACTEHFRGLHYKSSTSEIETNTEEKKETMCPFYYCCDLEDRKNHGNICKSKPWQLYEIKYKKDKMYCWYGQAMLELKGPSMPLSRTIPKFTYK